HVLELEHGARALAAHVFDGLLVADVVGALDGVVHVPAPVVLGIHAGDRAGDTALGGHGVRARREYLGDHGGVVAGLRQLQGGTKTGAPAPDDDAVERKGSDVSQGLDTP